MKKRKPTPKKASPSDPAVPSWLSDDPLPPKLTCSQIDYLAREVKKGISDTPAWKELVRRVGKKEAERILFAGIFSRHVVQGNPRN